MCALLEGITIYSATQDFNSAFKAPIVLRRIEEAAGPAGLAAFLAATEKLRIELERTKTK
jgi:hypothetical protein